MDAETQSVMDKMNMAADAAEQELRKKLEAMTPEQRAGAMAVGAWVKANYMAAGYKRLCKSLIAVTK